MTLLLLLRLVVKMPRQHTTAAAVWTTRSACVTRPGLPGSVGPPRLRGRKSRSSVGNTRPRSTGCSRPWGLSAVRQPVTPPDLRLALASLDIDLNRDRITIRFRVADGWHGVPPAVDGEAGRRDGRPETEDAAP